MRCIVQSDSFRRCVPTAIDTQCPTVATAQNEAPPSSSQAAASSRVAFESAEARERRLARIRARRRERLASETAEEKERRLARRRARDRARRAARSTSKARLEQMRVKSRFPMAATIEGFHCVTKLCKKKNKQPVSAIISSWVAPARQKCVAFI